MSYEDIKNYFWKKKRKKRTTKFEKLQQHNLFSQKKKKKSLLKKRNTIQFRFDFLKRLSFLKNTYIPIVTIFIWILLIISMSLYFSPLFRVNTVNIIKNDDITNMEIAYNAISNFRNMSILEIDKNEITKKIQDYQENIKTVQNSIVLPATLNIQIESFSPVFRVEIQKKNFLLLENGSLVPGTRWEKIPKLQIKKKFNHNSFLEYKKIFLESDIKKIIALIKGIQQNIIGTEYILLEYYVDEREFHITTKDEVKLIFSLDDNLAVKTQLKNLLILHNEYKKINEPWLIYIDARIKGKIFTCSKEENYNCKKNLNYLYGKYDQKKD